MNYSAVERIIRNIEDWDRKNSFQDSSSPRKLSSFSKEESEAINILAKYQKYEPLQIEDAFSKIQALADKRIAIVKNKFGYYLVNSEGYDYCRYIIKLDTTEMKSIMNQYRSSFDEGNKMKLTKEEKLKVKNFAKKLVEKKSLNEVNKQDAVILQFNNLQALIKELRKKLPQLGLFVTDHPDYADAGDYGIVISKVKIDKKMKDDYLAYKKI